MLKFNFTVDGTPILGLLPHSDKLVLLVCDTCKLENTTTFNNYSRAQEKFKRQGETFCKHCSSIKSGIDKRGKSIKKSGPRLNVHGDKHHSWKGGKFIASDGYVKVYLRYKTYRKEHFLVMEQNLGRKLLIGEVIHHVDLNKQNNRESNLVLLKNESIHRTAHNSLQNLSAVLIQAGLISFDRVTNTYMAVDKLRELLGQPEEANQQPSHSSDVEEGSTTRRESLRDDNSPTSPEQEHVPDDIV